MALAIPFLSGDLADLSSTGHPPAFYAALRQAGYRGVILDVLSTGWDTDYTAALSAGLLVMLYQGYWSPAWANPAEATTRARQAIAAADLVHYPVPAVIWLDLEGVPDTVSADSCAAWIDTWAGLVQDAGYAPGLYVGVPQPLSAQALYDRPAIQHYWRGCSADVVDVAVRGYQLRQSCGYVLSGIPLDRNTVALDALHGMPIGAFQEPTSPSPETHQILTVLRQTARLWDTL